MATFQPTAHLQAPPQLQQPAAGDLGHHHDLASNLHRRMNTSGSEVAGASPASAASPAGETIAATHPRPMPNHALGRTTPSDPEHARSATLLGQGPAAPRDALRAEPPSPATVQTAGCADKQNVQEALTSTKMLRTGRLNGPAKEAPNATWGLCIGDVQLVADARRSSPVLAMCDDANGHVPDNASPHRPPIAP